MPVPVAHPRERTDPRLFRLKAEILAALDHTAGERPAPSRSADIVPIGPDAIARRRSLDAVAG